MSDVFSTLQTKVSFQIAIVFTILILPYIDISLDDQVFSILLNGSSRSKKVLFGYKLLVIRKMNSQGIDGFFNHRNGPKHDNCDLD